MFSQEKTTMSQVEGCLNEGNPKRTCISHGHLDKIPKALNQHQERWETVNPKQTKVGFCSTQCGSFVKTQLTSPDSLTSEMTNLSSPAGHMNQDPSSFGPSGNLVTMAAPQLQSHSSKNIFAERDQIAAERNLCLRFH